jgi:hypothetical protein
MSNIYYSPHLPATAFDRLLRLVREAKVYPSATSRGIAFHVDVTPCEFSELLRETWAHRSEQEAHVSSLSVNDQWDVNTELAGYRSLHFYPLSETNGLVRRI